MIEQETLLVTLVTLVARIPVPPPPPKRQRGRPTTYADRLFLQALVIMIVVTSIPSTNCSACSPSRPPRWKRCAGS